MKTSNRLHSPAELMQSVMAFQKSKLILSAVELDIFTQLYGKSLDSTTLSQIINADAYALERLLNALVPLGLLHKTDELFSNTSLSDTILAKQSEKYMLGLGHVLNMYENWNHLTQSVLTGKPKPCDEINNRGINWIEAFIARMHERGIAKAVEYANIIKFSDNEKILDLGGGSGVFAMEFVRRTKGATAVVFDLPNVLPFTQKYIEKAGLSDRVTMISGDYLHDDFSGIYDTIFISAIIHINSFEQNSMLIKKCIKHLNPDGGRIIIQDFVMNEDKTQPIEGTMFSLNMLVGTAHGTTYSADEIEEWLSAKRINEIQYIDVEGGTQLIIVNY